MKENCNSNKYYSYYDERRRDSKKSKRSEKGIRGCENDDKKKKGS